jgi:Predicted nucleotide-binding protein containing TIR-like domain
MIKPTVFIGSSTEGLPIAEAVQANLDQEFEVTVWPQGVFLLGLANLENLTQMIGDYDFAILVLTPDDVVHSRGTQKAASRDNVIFELGLFMGAIGRDRAFALVDRTSALHIPSDLAGISLATYAPHSSGNTRSAVGAACTQLKQSFRRLGCKAKNEPSVFQPVDSSRLFDLGTELLRQVKSRVALVAKTPVLITGPRPYGEVLQHQWEMEQFDCLLSVLQRASQGNSLDFCCVGSLYGLQKDLDRDLALQANVRTNLATVFNAMADPASRISLRWSNDRFPMTYLVVDDQFLLWFKDAEDKFCLQRQDLRIANALWRQATANSTELTIDDVHDKLGFSRHG